MVQANTNNTVDLDKARAARREAQGEAPVVRFGSRDFVLPMEMPFVVVEHLGQLAQADDTDNAAVAAAILAILGDLFGDQYEAFMQNKPSMQDLTGMFDGIMAVYGVTVGESPASASSSKRISKKPRRVSSVSTG